MSRVMIALAGVGEWEFDDENLTLKDAFVIKEATGLAVKPFLDGVANFDPDCVQTLIWMLRRPTEPKLLRNQIEFRLMDLRIEQLDAESGPTSASETRSSDATDTSTRSRDGAGSGRKK